VDSSRNARQWQIAGTEARKFVRGDEVCDERQCEILPKGTIMLRRAEYSTAL
jgi:hypothetical protein